MLHLREHRPDILKLVASNATYCNEVFVEHINSIISRMLSSGAQLQFQDIRNASADVPIRRALIQQLKKIQERKKDPQKKSSSDNDTSEQHSEIRSQVYRFMSEQGPGYKQAKEVAEQFLVPLIKSFATAILTQSDTDALDAYRPGENEPSKFASRHIPALIRSLKVFQTKQDKTSTNQTVALPTEPSNNTTQYAQ